MKYGRSFNYFLLGSNLVTKLFSYFWAALLTLKKSFSPTHISQTKDSAIQLLVAGAT